MTDDVVIMPPDHPIVEGKESAVAYFRFREGVPSIKEVAGAVDRAEGHDDIGCAWGTFTLTVESGPGEPTSLNV
jgi:hypothetical protein